MKKTSLKNQTIAKPILLLAFCASVIWSSCRKDEKIPAPTNTKTTTTTTASMATLSNQIANNLAHSLAGKSGGVNLMGGIDTVTFRGARNLCSCYNNMPLCGFFTDSLVNLDSKEGDTTSHAGGNLKFYFNCQNGQKAGYTAYDSLGITRTTPSGWAQHYYIKQAYTIQSLDDKHQFIGVSGDNYFYQEMNLHCDCNNQSYTDIENSNYVLNNLTIDVCKKDILSGTATFKAYGYNWSLSGSVVFLGNHMADVTINGQVYHVDISQYSW